MIVLGHDDALGRWVHARTGGEWIPGSGKSIGWFNGEKITAAYTFTQYNGRNIFVDYAVDGDYLPKTLIWAVGTYAFEQLGCERLTLVAEASNLRSVKINHKLGAVHEATLTGAARDGGDILIFRLLPDDCPVWRKLRGKELKPAGST